MTFLLGASFGAFFTAGAVLALTHVLGWLLMQWASANL